MPKALEPSVTKGKRRAGQMVGYLRVSSLDQKEFRQLEGIALDKRFVDKASGKDLQRPQLEQLTQYVREGDTVVCHSMDRLARNLDDLRKLLTTQNNLANIRFYTLVRSRSAKDFVE